MQWNPSILIPVMQTPLYWKCHGLYKSTGLKWGHSTWSYSTGVQSTLLCAYTHSNLHSGLLLQERNELQESIKATITVLHVRIKKYMACSQQSIRMCTTHMHCNVCIYSLVEWHITGLWNYLVPTILVCSYRASLSRLASWRCLLVCSSCGWVLKRQTQIITVTHNHLLFILLFL